MKYFLISLLFISNLSFAIKPESEIDDFFDQLKRLNQEDAVIKLFSSNKWVASTSDQVLTMKKQVSVLKPDLVGELHKVIPIGEHNYKGVFLHKTYLALYDRQPILFEFQFYKPKNEWFFNGFSFNTDFDDKIEDEANFQDILKEVKI